MLKRVLLIVLVLVSIILVLALAVITARMYLLADANFTISYSSYSLILLPLIFLGALLGFSYKPCRALGVFLAVVLLANFAFKQLVFGGSLEELLYTRNKALYHEVASEIVDRGFEGNVYFQGERRKLSRNMTIVTRQGKDVIIDFYISSALFSPSRIIYATNMEATLKEDRKRGADCKVVDPNWYVGFFD